MCVVLRERNNSKFLSRETPQGRNACCSHLTVVGAGRVPATPCSPPHLGVKQSSHKSKEGHEQEEDARRQQGVHTRGWNRILHLRLVADAPRGHSAQHTASDLATRGQQEAVQEKQGSHGDMRLCECAALVWTLRQGMCANDCCWNNSPDQTYPASACNLGRFEAKALRLHHSPTVQYSI